MLDFISDIPLWKNWIKNNRQFTSRSYLQYLSFLTARLSHLSHLQALQKCTTYLGVNDSITFRKKRWDLIFYI